MNKTKGKDILRWLLSPTLFISDRYKQKAPTKAVRGERVKQLNRTYFYIALCILFMVGILPQTVFQNPSSKWGIYVVIGYCISRCNEIFMAFIRDVFDKLITDKRDKNGLEYFERIRLALRSYVELALNYSMIYYLLDQYIKVYKSQQLAFNHVFANLFDAIYFSVITIVSIGYGDIYPTHPLSKFLVMYEVINGTLLLVVSFTVYVNLTLGE